MEMEERPYKDLEPISRLHCLLGVGTSFIFFWCINIYLQWAGPPKNVGTKDIWKWKNIQISFIHAVIIGIWNLSWYAKSFIFSQWFDFIKARLILIIEGYFLVNPAFCYS